MYILTDKNKENENAIMHISETLNRQEGNNYYLIKNDSIAIPPEFVKEVYEVDEIPEGVEEYKYCYTPEDGFYKNVNYREYFSEEDRISALEDAVNTLLGF